MGSFTDPSPPMRVVVYSALSHEEQAFATALQASGAKARIDVVPTHAPLDTRTALLAKGARAVVVFPGDATSDPRVLNELRTHGVELLIVRHAGRPDVDARAAAALQMRVAQPPVSERARAAAAEYAVALLLALQRRTCVALARARAGCLGRLPPARADLAESVVGLIGTIAVAARVAGILRAFGATVLAADPVEDGDLLAAGAEYAPLAHLLAVADVLVLDAPRSPATRGILGDHALAQCKRGVHIVSTADSDLIDMRALIDALRSGRVGAVAMDVYDANTAPLFREDGVVNRDLKELSLMPNVLITAHQSTLTAEVCKEVATACVHTLVQFCDGSRVDYELDL